MVRAPGLFHGYSDAEFLDFSGCDEVQAEFVFGGIGWAHPGLDAVIRGLVVERPSHNRGISCWDRGIADTDADGAGAIGLPKEDFVTAQIGVLGIDQVRVRKWFYEIELGTGGELAGGEIVFVAACRRNADLVIGARRTLGPR